MGNCALKPIFLSKGSPAPEELKDSLSLVEDEKIDAAKSLSNLFLQDKADKKTKEEEKITPEKTPVPEDLKTDILEKNYPTTETKSPADDHKIRNEEAVGGEKVIDDVTVKETETEAKAEEVVREAAARTMKET